MRDPADKQTQTLPLEQKRGRGRPATGQALSNAERQRAYRERQKAQRNENESSTQKTSSVELLRERALSRGKTCVKQARMIQDLEARIQELESQLAKAKAKAAKAGPTKRRYVLQYRYEDAYGVHWQDDSTGDYGSKREAEKACSRMNEPGVSEAEWRVRERQWV